MAPSIFAAEGAIALATTAAISLSLYTNAQQGWRLDVACLVGLTLLACAVESALGARLRLLYTSREAETPGLALGLLLVPWVLAAVEALHAALGPPAAELALGARSAVAASALTLVLLVMQLPSGELLRMDKKETPTLAPDDDSAAGTSPFHPSSGRAAPEQSPHFYSWPEAAALQGTLPAALAIITAASIAAMLGSGSLGEGLGVLGAAALACSLYQAALVLLPHCFTVGEAVVAAQALSLLAAWVARCAAASWHGAASSPSLYDFDVFVGALLLGSTAAGGVVIALLSDGSGGPAAAAAAAAAAGPAAAQAGAQRSGAAGWTGPLLGRPGSGTHAAVARGVLARRVAAAAVLVAAAFLAIPLAVWVLQFALATWARAGLLAYWAALLTGSLPAMAWLARSKRVSNIIVRKGYHLLAVALFAPALLTEPALLGVSLAVAYAALVAVEVARLSGLPGVGPRVYAFMTSFTDGRDSGLLLVTHFTLLLGMAVPVWLSNALHPPRIGVSGDDGPPEGGLWPSALAGITILGLGDAAASVAGRAFGRLPVCAGSKKTVEGAAACTAATLLAWVALAAGGGGAAVALPPWWALVAATAASSLLEAATVQLDNVFVPLHYFALLCVAYGALT